MSSTTEEKKVGTTKNEPLKIESTTFKINIRSTGDLKTKEYDLIPFHPNMADMSDLSNNNYILFPSFVKITMNDLKNAGVGQDYKKVFTTIDKYIRLIKYVTSPEKETDNALIVDPSQLKNYATTISFDNIVEFEDDSIMKTVQKIGPLTDEEIITNNIGLIKNLFFPREGRFYVLNHEYVIGKSKYIPPYKTEGKNTHISAKEIPLTYQVTFNLELLDAINNPGAGNFAKMSCKAKKANIKNEMTDLFGIEFKEEEKKAVLPSLLTPVVKMKRGFGPMQIEWEKRNEYKKVAETEKEREEYRKKMTKLERKMEKYDKLNEDYNKIPNLLIQEWKEIETKYDTMQTDIKKYEKEKMELEKNAASNGTNSFITEQLAKLTRDIAELNAKKSMDNKNKEMEKAAKEYTKDIVKEMQSKKTEIDNLLSEEKKIYDKLDTMKKTNDKYNIPTTTIELNKIQAILLKKKTENEMFLKKNGNDPGDGTGLIGKWMTLYGNMRAAKNDIENDKSDKEREETEKSIVIELKDKEEDIKEAREKLFLKLYILRDYDEITTKEKDEAAKQSKKEPIPSETPEQLQKNVDALMEDYLTITDKFGKYDNALQKKIEMLDKETKRFKTILDDQNKTANDLKKSIEGIDSKIKTIYDKYKTRSGGLTIIGDGTVTGATDEDNARIKDYINDKAPFTEKLVKIKPKVIKSEIKFRIYEYYIKALQKVISLPSDDAKREEVALLKTEFTTMLDSNKSAVEKKDLDDLKVTINTKENANKEKRKRISSKGGGKIKKSLQKITKRKGRRGNLKQQRKSRHSKRKARRYNQTKAKSKKNKKPQKKKRYTRRRYYYKYK